MTSAIPAPASMVTASTSCPAAKLPVAFSSQLISGDENAPPVLAIVLISAMPPTAPMPLMNEVDSDQNGPIMLIIPTWAIVRASRTSQGDCRVALSHQPAAASRAKSARCHRRSPVRSECRPIRNMAMAVATFGIT